MKHILFFWGWMLAVVLVALRDWFIALCGLVIYTGVARYPELPQLTEVHGANAWSVMLLAVIVCWLIQRRGRFDIPRGWQLVIALYIVVELFAVVRTSLNVGMFGRRAAEATGNPAYDSYTVKGFLVDFIYVPAKYMLVGLLLMDGARTRKRLWYGIGALVLCGCLFSIVINKSVPLEGLMATGDDMLEFRHRVGRETGVHPNDVAVYLSTSFWITLSMWPILRRKPLWLRAGAVLILGSLLIALLHTHSRGGYLGFVGTAVVLTIVQRSWRSFAALCLMIVGVCFAFPSVPARMLSGVGVQSVTGEQANDMDEITAGRNIIWSAAVRGIAESPIIGYGHFGYVMSSAIKASEQEGGGELHPHCAYLEVLLDVGVLGAPLVFAPLIYVFVMSLRLLRQRPNDPVLNLVGAAGLAAVSTIMLQGLTGQHFVFHENLFYFWCMAGLVVRAATLAPLSVTEALPARNRAVPVSRELSSV